LSENGSGLPERKSGTDSMLVNGTTGDHPRLDSPEEDGPSTRATGIIVDTSSNSSEETGTDSKERNGSNTDPEFHSNQASQEDQRSADHSMSSRNTDSQPPFLPEDSLDVKLVEEEEPLSTCGRIMPHADSLEEDSCTTDSRSVKLEDHTVGQELPDVLEVQFLPARDSTTKLVMLTEE
jgi:hypothetical protein